MWRKRWRCGGGDGDVEEEEEEETVWKVGSVELLRNEEVQAIIGPQTSNEAKFVASLGEKAQIPIISFSVTSPSLTPTVNRFFIRTALDDSCQLKAITSIVQAYGWHEVVLIYEDTEYGNGLVPYIIDALQQIDTRVSYRSVISPSSSPLKILEELNKLMAMQTRVFLVHMTPSFGSQLFVLAKDAGMMSEEYAWIITDGLSSVLDPLEGKVIDSMEGVVGVRPYVPMSTALDDFKMRWKQKQTHFKINAAILNFRLQFLTELMSSTSPTMLPKPTILQCRPRLSSLHDQVVEDKYGKDAIRPFLLPVPSLQKLACSF
ncbi:hypothetical protein ACLB2K_039050 [Fragaria x ananassa]